MDIKQFEFGIQIVESEIRSEGYVELKRTCSLGWTSKECQKIRLNLKRHIKKSEKTKEVWAVWEKIPMHMHILFGYVVEILWYSVSYIHINDSLQLIGRESLINTVKYPRHSAMAWFWQGQSRKKSKHLFCLLCTSVKEKSVFTQVHVST